MTFNYWEEKERKLRMSLNYKMGKYEEKDCLNCGALIEDYSDLKKGLCLICQEDIDSY